MRIKRSSLFDHFISDNDKEFYDIGTWVPVDISGLYVVVSTLGQVEGLQRCRDGVQASTLFN